MCFKGKGKIWKFNVTNTCPRKVEVQSQRPFRFPRNPRSYLIDVYLVFISSHRRFKLLNARLFYIPFHSMSHWSTHRLILLLHKYYDGYEDDIKGSAARALDDGYFRLTASFSIFSTSNWAEPCSIPSRSELSRSPAPFFVPSSRSYPSIVTASTRSRFPWLKK